MSIFYITSKLKRKEPFSSMAEVFLNGISEHLKRISVPRSGDKIYKEECVFSFDTPVSSNIVSKRLCAINSAHVKNPQ